MNEGQHSTCLREAVAGDCLLLYYDLTSITANTNSDRGRVTDGHEQNSICLHAHSDQIINTHQTQISASPSRDLSFCKSCNEPCKRVMLLTIRIKSRDAPYGSARALQQQSGCKAVCFTAQHIAKRQTGSQAEHSCLVIGRAAARDWRPGRDLHSSDERSHAAAWQPCPGHHRQTGCPSQEHRLCQPPSSTGSQVLTP